MQPKVKISKKYSFSDNNQIWRILISESDKLILETRDINTKEVFFHCLDVFSGSTVFQKFQLDEKYWVGIEAIYKDIIYFHKFVKPDMPGHKQITAFDIKTQSLLWHTDDYAFQFVYNDKAYCFRQKFEGKNYYSLNFKTGEMIEDLGNNFAEINRLSSLAEESKDYSHYYFPQKFDHDKIDNNSAKEEINKRIKKLEIVGDIEYTVYKYLLLMNYHSHGTGENLTNSFVAVNLSNGKEKLSEILNANSKAYVPDSFFVYKDLLFLLKEKDRVLVFSLPS